MSAKGPTQPFAVAQTPHPKHQTSDTNNIRFDSGIRGQDHLAKHYRHAKTCLCAKCQVSTKRPLHKTTQQQFRKRHNKQPASHTIGLTIDPMVSATAPGQI